MDALYFDLIIGQAYLFAYVIEIGIFLLVWVNGEDDRATMGCFISDVFHIFDEFISFFEMCFIELDIGIVILYKPCEHAIIH